MPDTITYANFQSTHFQIFYHKSQRFLLMDENIYHSPPLGKEQSSFCQVLQSDVTFRTEDGIVTAAPGDFLYMPDSIRYQSHWIGYPEVEFISTFFRLTSLKNDTVAFDNELFRHSPRPVDQQIAFQNIRELGNYRMKEPMEMLQKLDRHDPVQHLQALSILYEIFSQVYPYLEMRKPKKRPDVLEPALSYIDRSYTLNEPVSVYAALCHLSESRFHHLFAQHMKCTPIEYRNTLRIRRAAQLLNETNQSIEQISSGLGFESAIYFRRVFKTLYACTPSAFRKRG